MDDVENVDVAQRRVRLRHWLEVFESHQRFEDASVLIALAPEACRYPGYDVDVKETLAEFLPRRPPRVRNQERIDAQRARAYATLGRSTSWIAEHLHRSESDVEDLLASASVQTSAHDRADSVQH